MHYRLLAFISLLIIPAITYGQNAGQQKKVVEEVTLSLEVDDPEPPPPNLVSKFSTMQAWLANICDGKKPRKAITEYQIGLFFSDKRVTLFLNGTNTYGQGTSRQTIKIEFEPKEKYYLLPAKYNAKLNHNELYKKIKTDIKRFCTTPKFRSSFLTKADQLVFEPTGTTIWSKKQP